MITMQYDDPRYGNTKVFYMFTAMTLKGGVVDTRPHLSYTNDVVACVMCERLPVRRETLHTSAACCVYTSLMLGGGRAYIDSKGKVVQQINYYMP